MTQPDQDIARWDRYAGAYERAFEPLTDTFNRAALALLGPLADMDLIDVAAGTGGAAMAAVAQGARVVAVDASAAMVVRITERGVGRIEARVADAGMLPFDNASFDVALSSFGVILMPDPGRGMAELHRVLRPHGRVGIVTWTEPHRYELATRLRNAAIAIRGQPPASELPAQLRFTDPDRLHALLAEAGFENIRIARTEASLHAPTAAALAQSLAFAPGMAAMLDALGPHRPAVLEHFATALIADHGSGPVTLGAVAHIAVATRPWFAPLTPGVHA